MNTCKNCRFWGDEKGHENVFRTQIADVKFCGAVGWSDGSKKEKTDAAFTVSYEESCLYTREDFGCTLFEAK
jgi:hypothetical protein